MNLNSTLRPLINRTATVGSERSYLSQWDCSICPTTASVAWQIPSRCLLSPAPGQWGPCRASPRHQSSWEWQYEIWEDWSQAPHLLCGSLVVSWFPKWVRTCRAHQSVGQWQHGDPSVLPGTTDPSSLWCDMVSTTVSLIGRHQILNVAPALPSVCSALSSHLQSHSRSPDQSWDGEAS